MRRIPRLSALLGWGASLLLWPTLASGTGPSAVGSPLVLAQPSSGRSLDLSLVGGLTNAKLSGSTSSAAIEYRSNVGFSTGALVAIDAGWGAVGRTSLEAGLLYTQRKFSLVGSPTTPTVDLVEKGIELPLVMRFWACPWLGLGAGPYAFLGVGDVTVTRGGQDSRMSYDDVGHRRFDLGLVASAQLRYALTGSLSILLDARYQVGLIDLARDQYESLGSHAFQLLAGGVISL